MSLPSSASSVSLTLLSLCPAVSFLCLCLFLPVSISHLLRGPPSGRGYTIEGMGLSSWSFQQLPKLPFWRVGLWPWQPCTCPWHTAPSSRLLVDTNWEGVGQRYPHHCCQTAGRPAPHASSLLQKLSSKVVLDHSTLPDTLKVTYDSFCSNGSLAQGPAHRGLRWRADRCPGEQGSKGPRLLPSLLAPEGPL